MHLNIEQSCNKLPMLYIDHYSSWMYLFISKVIFYLFIYDIYLYLLKVIKDKYASHSLTNSTV